MNERFDWLETERKPAAAPALPAEGFDARAYLQRAERAFRRGDREAALAAYGQALGEDAALAEAWVGQVRCLVELDELAEARVWANKGLERFPQNAELLAAKGLVLARQGEALPAMEFSDLSLSRKDASPLVWLLRGLVLLRVERERSGEARCFRKALEAGDPDGALGLRAGLGYLDAGEPAKARPLLEACVARDPENALAWYALGLAFERLYALGRAVACLERAYGLRPEFKPKVVDALRAVRERPWWRRLLGSVRAALGDA
ncbi:MAG: tetratricopeptide repeat protein [Elusimicrobia bacterium]|nr:tetratricopeptide repeat protein [Elusimicrobiota bacterium]